MPRKFVPDSLRTLLVGSQANEGLAVSAGSLVTMRAVTSWEPLYQDSYEMPRFENASGWSEEEAYGTTSMRGMRISGWVDSNDIGWLLANVMRCVDTKTGPVSSAYTHVMIAAADNLLANPYLTFGWSDGSNDGAGTPSLEGYMLQDGRVTQLVLSWDYAANAWRFTANIDGTPLDDYVFSLAGVSARNRLGKIMLPKHSRFQIGAFSSATAFTGTSYPLISGNITLNNGAGPIFGSTTGSDPDGTASQLLIPQRREDGNMSGRYNITYDKALMRRLTTAKNNINAGSTSDNTTRPFVNYLAGTHEAWDILVFGIGGGHSLSMQLPYGKYISGGPNIAAQRSTRETVEGMIGIDQNTSRPTYPFKATLVNGYAGVYAPAA